MKHFMKMSLALVIVCCLCLPVYGADNCKVAIVDFQQIQQKAVKAQKIRDELVKKLTPQGKELEKAAGELRKLTDELKNQSMMLSLDAKEDRQLELERKSREYKFMESEFMQAQKQAQYEMVKRIGVDIQKLVSDIGKKGGYTLILEKSGAGLLFYDEKIDITDQLIKAYDNMK